MGRKDKPRMIPEQDKRICGSICFCTLTVVLSGVSIVYLSVAIYSPSYKAFRSGFELEPVMCQTIDLNMTNNCRWASCGEWCLTKTSGFCPQIKSTVRRNGTEIQLNNCTKVTNILCPQIDPGKLKKYNCNNGSLCSVLHGVFNCSMGHCRNMSEFYQCHHKPDGPTLDPEQDNTKLNGFFYCFGPKCTKIKKPFTCDRFCPKITTFDVNVLIMQDNSLFTADCNNGVALTESHGKDPAVKISPTEFWNDTGGIMLANCMSVTKEGNNLRATDCLNGTLLEHDSLPHAFMNFTQFWKIYQNSNRLLDPSQRFLPKQSNITIYDSSRLFINLEGCVNTLRGECVDFAFDYGSDGDNDTAQSRYLCYYNKNNQDFVIARFDLAKTWKELLIALIIPIVLFVISSIVLFVLTKSVRVGDDTKMRCKYCVDGNNSDMDESYVVNTNPRSIKRYRVEAEPTPASEINEQIRELNMLESHEMVGSTKSLIPLSPCEDTTTDKTMSTTDDNPTELLTEKPLVII